MFMVVGIAAHLSTTQNRMAISVMGQVMRGLMQDLPDLAIGSGRARVVEARGPVTLHKLLELHQHTPVRGQGTINNMRLNNNFGVGSVRWHPPHG
jgi:hypothetical protein